jgi:hypothetical protein
LELEGTQNNDLLRELRSIVTGDSSGQQASEYLCDEPKQFFYAHPPDATAWYREQQEKRCIHISEIVKYSELQRYSNLGVSIIMMENSVLLQ